MARNDQFENDPKLPQFQNDPLTWLSELSTRLQALYLRLANALNLLIQGYQYVTTTLSGSVFGPSATTRGRVLIVNGSGTVPDRIYLCNWDGTAYQWSKFALFESTTAAWTPGTVANGASVSVNVSVPRVGAVSLAAAFISPALPAGMAVFATVTATGDPGTVNVILYNLSGSSQTVGASTVTIYLIQ
jgi:hypothetical protein